MENVPAVDLDALRESMREAEIEDMIDIILETYRADALERIEALRSAVAAADTEAVRRAAHAYKSAAATIRADRLAELLQQLEHTAAEGVIEGQAERLAGIEAEYDAVEKLLDDAGF